MKARWLAYRTFLTPGVQAGDLDACGPGRFGAVVCDIELRAVDVELRVHDVGEDVLEADEVFSGGGCGWDGEVPLSKRMDVSRGDEIR